VGHAAHMGAINIYI